MTAPPDCPAEESARRREPDASLRSSFGPPVAAMAAAIAAIIAQAIGSGECLG